MNEPLVSVIIPCFNGGRFLREAVNSIKRQGYPSIEIIIVDDGSTDDSAAIAAELGAAVTYIFQENRGLPGARNTGLDHVRGELITFLDQDEVYSDDKIRLQVDLFEDDPGLEIVVGRMQKTQLSGHDKGQPVFTPYEEPAPALKMDCALIRREVFNKIGRFDESRNHCDDWDWFMRAREAGVRFKMHEEVVAEYRRHESNMTNNVEVGNRHTLQMLKNSLERRRRQHGEARSLPSLLKDSE
jgi:glycosyltransferase involved in cell wall biosynthesis